MFGFTNEWRDENDVIKHITEHKSADLREFLPLFASPEKDYIHEFFFTLKGFYVFTLIDRKALFPCKPFRKPGDIDILIIPFSEETIFFERSIAVEVKVIRPTLPKKGKSPNSFGTTQANGLLLDGFPYVCILYVIMTEPTKAEDYRQIQITGAPIANKEEARQDITKYLESSPFTNYDPFPMESTERLFGKLSKMAIPQGINLLSITLNFTENNVFKSFNGAFERKVELSEKRNPFASLESINSIEGYYKANLDERKTIEIHHPE